MTPQQVEALFARNGGYVFARWGRPIAPVVFGVAPETLGIIKGAFEAVSLLARHPLAETDPELGSNLMVFFLRDWAELAEVPDLEALIPELPDLLPRLQAQNASQYRLFRFDGEGAIKACFAFLRMDAAMADLPAQTIALDLAVRSILLWGEDAFADRLPLADTRDGAELRADLAAVIRAAYDPVMPATAHDPSHALRIVARAETP